MRFLFFFLSVINVLSFFHFSLPVVNADSSAFGIVWKSHNDRVVDVANGQDADGTTVRFWPPNGPNGSPGWAQAFEWVNGDQLRWWNTDKCLDVYDARMDNNNPIILWTCNHHTFNQKWVKDGDFIRWKGTNKCMNVRGVQYQPAGAILQIYDCHSQSDRFSIPSPSSFRIQWDDSSSRVITPLSTNDAASVVLSLSSGSNDSPNLQYFEWFNGDQLRVVGLDNCLDVSGGVNAIGTPLQLYGCDNYNGQINQKFRMNGKQIQWKGGDNNKCLMAGNTNTGALGPTVQLGACDDPNTLSKRSFLLPSPPVFRIEVDRTNRQFEVTNSIDNNGVYVIAVSPNGRASDNQSFEWINGDQIRWVGTNKCLDVDHGRMDNGTPIQIWTCDTNSPHQRFTRMRVSVTDSTGNNYTGDKLRWKGTQKCIVAGDQDGEYLKIRDCGWPIQYNQIFHIKDL